MTRFARAPLARAVMAVALVSGVAACTHTPVMPDTPLHGKVSDIDEFRRFVAARPTPEQFRQRYPDIHLVMPGDIATREVRSDNSRFFAETGDDGRIVGGKFM